MLHHPLFAKEIVRERVERLRAEAERDRLAASVRRRRGRTMRFVLEFTEWAVEILGRSHAAARRFNPEATVRVHRTADGVAFELADERRDGDELVRGEGFELWVEPGLEGTVDVVEPHDRLILRPPGDPERSVRAH